MRAGHWLFLSMHLSLALSAAGQAPDAPPPRPRPQRVHNIIREPGSLDWRLVASAPSLSVFDTAALGVDLRLHRIGTHSRQAVGPDAARTLSADLTAEERTRLVAAFEERGVRAPVHHVERIGTGDEARPVFQLARDLGVRLIVAAPEPAALPALETLANEFEIDVAVESRGARETPAYAEPAALMAALKGRGPRIGVSVDLRRWTDEGVQYQNAVEVVKERLRHVTLSNAPSLDGVLRHMFNLKMKPVFFTVEVKDAAELRASVEAFEKIVEPWLAGPRPAWQPGIPLTTNMVASLPRLLDWRLVTTSPSATLLEAAARSAERGARNVQGSRTQRVSAALPKELGPDLSVEELATVTKALRDLRVQLAAYRVPSLANEAEARALFSFAKTLNIPLIVAAAEPPSLTAVDALASEFGLSVAIESADPGKTAASLAGLGRRLGLSVAAKDAAAVTERVAMVRLGGDGTETAAVLRDMWARKMKPLVFTVESEDGIEAYETAVQPILGEVVNQASLTLPIRSAEKLHPAMKERIAAAVPRQPPARPRQPRKLLVLDICHLGMSHETIPHANHALELMGRTGAFEAVFSNDLTNLRYEKIRQYDAVFLNNTVGEMFADPQVREGLLRFVREGGGLGALHGATYAARSWPELAQVLGATEAPHRIETATLKVDDPSSPLMKAFTSRSFPYTDELYRFPHVGPANIYSRENLHVLLSIDTEKSDLVQGVPLYERPDGDYGLVWIRRYGKGRVYNNALGHLDTLFVTPAMVEHLFAAVQFLLGDLDADTTPSAKLAAKKEK